MAGTFSAPAYGAWIHRPPHPVLRGVADRAVKYGLVAAAAAVLAACGSTSGSTRAGPGAGTPAVSGQTAAHRVLLSSRNLPGLGAILVDASGKTVYTPQQEADGKIKCTGGCLSFWFPVKVSQAATLSAATGVTGRLGEIHRADDGVTQLTYNGMPLYTFHLDQAPGQAEGNNFTDSFGGVTFNWHALTPSGSPAKQSQAGGSPGYNNGGGGSGY
jgi:predicted lipoprotein with Yx(FWY)xxD motif